MAAAEVEAREQRGGVAQAAAARAVSVRVRRARALAVRQEGAEDEQLHRAVAEATCVPEQRTTRVSRYSKGTGSTVTQGGYASKMHTQARA